jgi:hypothetical protein
MSKRLSYNPKFLQLVTRGILRCTIQTDSLDLDDGAMEIIGEICPRILTNKYSDRKTYTKETNLLLWERSRSISN